MISRIRARQGAVAFVAALLLASSGCQLPFDLTDAGKDQSDLQESLRFEYDAVGGAGYIDQALNITNTADTSMLIEAEIEALDEHGEVLPGVEVSSVYGAAERDLVLVPGANVDFLVFEGQAAKQAVDVKVTVQKATAVNYPVLLQVVEAVPLTADGDELDYPAGFDQVALRNPNAAAASVRIAFIVWNTPKAGETQQALHVIEVGGLVEVPPRGETIVEVTASVRRAMDRAARMQASSLKAYFSQ